MIKTFKHYDIEKRDKDVNEFILKHGSFAIQTNIGENTEDYEGIIYTTIFWKA